MIAVFDSGRYVEDLRTALDSVPDLGLDKKTILLTGATGLIGSCVADMLLLLKSERTQGLRIILAGRSEKRMRERFWQWEGLYEFVLLDSLAYDSTVPEADYYIHCAGNAHPAAYRDYPVETEMGNAIGARAILETIKAAGHGRLLYLSSSEVYGKKADLSPYTESDYGYVDILDSRSCYPVSKRFVENLCASYAAEYDVDFVVARPGHIYGPTFTSTDTRVHAEFARRVLNGDPIVLKSDGSQTRSYCYITDCATALLTILLKGETGQAYNISNKDSVISIRDMAELFAKAGGIEVVYEMPNNDEKKAFNPMATSALDANRLESLGWKAEVTPEAGIRRTLEILKDSRSSSSR